MEDQAIEMIHKQARSISKRPYGWVFDIDYLGDIGDPDEYVEDFEVFRNATSHDVIRIHINNLGGNLNTLIQIINNIRACEATIITFLESEAHSAAGSLFLEGDQYVLGDHSSMLIHESTFGIIESSNKFDRQYEHIKTRTRRVFEDYYKDFLSQEEIDEVLKGGDLWLNKEDIEERLIMKVEAQEKREQSEEEGDSGSLAPSEPYAENSLNLKESLSKRTKGYLLAVLDDLRIDNSLSIRDKKKTIVSFLLENANLEVLSEIVYKS